MNPQSRKAIRDYISNLIQKRAVDSALSWLASKVAWLTTGPLGWLTNKLLVYTWNKYGDKMVRWATRNGAYVYDKGTGLLQAKKITRARESGNASDYDDSIDDMLG